MSTSIDERVVEMRFDNKQFEANVKESMSTLDKLKAKLDMKGAGKGLEDLEKASRRVDLNPIVKATETVKLKFDAMQVAAITAMTRMTNAAITAGEKLVKSLSVDNIAAGWQKFSEKTTSVGTLVAQGYDLTEVTKQLNRLNWFTDETSYNFTDMVSSIAKFTASGRKLNESVTALEGIANWAALSGQNATTASRAMYQISQAMGAGVMRKEDYKSIQNVSMDTQEFRQHALDAAVALGTLRQNADGTYQSLTNLNKESFTINQFAEHLTEDAWFTSDVMMKVFNDYSNAVDQIYEYAESHGVTASEAIEALADSLDSFGIKAFKAAQEARTWGDVVDSVKDAVSTGWAKTFEIIFGNYEVAKTNFTELANILYDLFAGGAFARNDLLSGAFLSGWERFSQILADSPYDVKKFQDTVRELSGMTPEAFDEMVEAAGGFDKSLESGWLTIDMTKEALDRLAKEILNDTNGSAVALATFQERLSRMTDEEFEALGATDEQIAGFRKWASQIRVTDDNLADFERTMSRPSGTSLLFGSMFNVLTAIQNTINAIKQGFTDVFGVTTSDMIYNIVFAINQFTQRLADNESAVANIGRVFKGLFSILHIFWQLISSIGKALKPLFGTIGDLGESVLGAAGSFGEWLSLLDKFIEENDIFGQAIGKIVEWVTTAWNKIKEFVKSLGFSKIEMPGLQKVEDFFVTLWNNLKNLDFTAIGNQFKNLWKSITEIKLEDALDGIGGFFERVWKKITEIKLPKIQFLENLKSQTSAAADSIETRIGDIFKNPRKILDSIVNFFKNFHESIVSVSDKLRERFGDDFRFSSVISLGIMALIVAITNNIAKALKAIANPFESFGDIIDATTGYLNALTSSVKAEAIHKIAEAIISLVGAVAILTLLHSLYKEDVYGALKILGIIAGGLLAFTTALTWIMTQMDKLMLTAADTKSPKGLASIAAKFASIAAVLTAVSTSAFLLSLAVGRIAKLRAEGSLTDKDVWAVIGMMTALVALTRILSGHYKKFTMGDDLKNIDKSINVGALTMLGIAASVLILVKALKIIKDVDFSWDTIVKLGAIMTGLGILAGFARKVPLGAGVLFIGISYALITLIKSVDRISKLDLDEAKFQKNFKMIKQILTWFGIIVGAFAVATLISGKKDVGRYAGQIGFAMVGMAAGVYIIVASLKKIAELDDSQIKRSGTVVRSVLRMFAIIVAAFGAAEFLTNLKSTGDTVRSAGRYALRLGGAMLEIAGAVLLLGIAMAMLSMIPNDDGALTRAFEMVAGLMGLYAIVIAAAGTIKDARGLASTIASITLAMGIVIGSLIALTLFDVDNKALKSMAAISGVLLSLGAVLWIISKMPVLKEGQRNGGVGKLWAMIPVLLAIGGILFAMQLFLPNHDGDKVLKDAEAIGIIMGALAVSLAALSLLKNANTKGINGTLGVLIGAIGAIGIVLGLMQVLVKDQNVWTMIGDAAAIGLLLNALASSLVILSLVRLDSALALKQLHGTLAIMTALSGGMAVILGLLASFATADPVKMIASAASLGLLMNALSAAVLVLSFAKFDGKDNLLKLAGALAIVELATGLLAAILIGLPLEKLNLSIEQAGALGILLLALAGAVDLVSLVGNAAGPAALGALVLGELVVVLGAALAILVGLFGWLSGYGWFDDGLNAMEKMLTKIGSGIGSAIKAVDENMPEKIGFGEKLATFMTDLQPFVDGLMDLPPDIAQKAALLAEALAVITGASFLDDLRNSLTPIGQVRTLIDVIFPGDQSGLTAKFKTLGEALGALAEGANGVDLGRVGDIADVLKKVTEATSLIPVGGSLLGLITGDSSVNLKTYGEHLGDLMEGLKTFAEKSLEVSEDGLKQGIRYIEVVGRAMKFIPDPAGLWNQLITGESGSWISDFATALPELAAGIGAFSRAMDGVKLDGIDTGIAALEKLSVIDELVPTQDGLFGTLFGVGDKKIGDFGTNLTSLAAGLKDFSDDAGTISGSYIDQGVAAIQKIMTLDMPVTPGGFLSMLFADQFSLTIGSFSTNLNEFVSGIQVLGDTGKDINIVGVNNVMNAAGQILNFNATIDDGEKMSTYAESLTTFMEALRVFVTDTSTILQFKPIGEYIVEGITTGITENKADATTEIILLISACYNAMTSEAIQNQFGILGQYIVEGVATGITNNKGVAINAFVQLGQDLVREFEAAMQIASPSKITYKDGKWLVEGITEGITDDMSAEEAAKKKAENIVAAFQTVFDKADLNIRGLKSTLSLMEKTGGILEKDAKGNYVLRQLGLEEYNEVAKEKLWKSYEELQANVATAAQEYEFTAQQTGEDSDETREAYMKLEDAIIAAQEAYEIYAQAVLDATAGIKVTGREKQEGVEKPAGTGPGGKPLGGTPNGERYEVEIGGVTYTVKYGTFDAYMKSYEEGMELGGYTKLRNAYLAAVEELPDDVSLSDIADEATGKTWEDVLREQTGWTMEANNKAYEAVRGYAEKQSGYIKDAHDVVNTEQEFLDAVNKSVNEGANRPTEVVLPPEPIPVQVVASTTGTDADSDAEDQGGGNGFLGDMFNKYMNGEMSPQDALTGVATAIVGGAADLVDSKKGTGGFWGTVADIADSTGIIDNIQDGLTKKTNQVDVQFGANAEAPMVTQNWNITVMPEESATELYRMEQNARAKIAKRP